MHLFRPQTVMQLDYVGGGSGVEMDTIRVNSTNRHAAFQTAELGRVDVGGGGTIAYILAEYGMNVIDCGVPVLSMHAPWEVVDKADMYEALKAYRAFLKYA